MRRRDESLSHVCDRDRFESGGHSRCPISAGQVIEVVLLVREDDQTSTLRRLDHLLKTTQALPHVQALTDDDIAAETEAYRNGH